MDSTAAAAAGHRHLANWMREVEMKWRASFIKRADGEPRMTIIQQIDHNRKLSQQTGAIGTKIVYAKAGTLLNAAILEDDRTIIDHKAYWALARNIHEARFVVAVINSPAVLARVIPMQPRGWRDARDFDNLVWELPIPEFDAENSLHAEIAVLASEAEAVAAEVVLQPNAHYMRHRRAIRDAIDAAGLTARIDALVLRLLDG